MEKTSEKQETKHQRGKNFSPSDDKNICIGWLAVSQDPLKSRDQQGDLFWKDVQEHAQVKNRNSNAVRQRWGYISRNVTKFVECYESIVRHTGGMATSLEDLYNDAVKLYLAETNTRQWKFFECWEILRYNPKFINFYETRTEKRGTIPSTLPSQLSPPSMDNLDFESNAGGTCYGDLNSTSEISIAYHGENAFEQPSDWKKVKSYETQQELERRRVEALETLAVAAMRKNELLAEHTRAINAATETKIITTSGENLDSLSLQILELKKTKILIELQRSYGDTNIIA